VKTLQKQQFMFAAQSILHSFLPDNDTLGGLFQK